MTSSNEIDNDVIFLHTRAHADAHAQRGREKKYKYTKQNSKFFAELLIQYDV